MVRRHIGEWSGRSFAIQSLTVDFFAFYDTNVLGLMSRMLLPFSLLSGRAWMSDQPGYRLPCMLIRGKGIKGIAGKYR